MPENSPTAHDSRTNKYLAEYKSWLFAIGFVFTAFILFVTFTSWLNHVFHWELLPIFQNSLNDFRAFTHLIFEWTFFAPLSYILEYTWYVVTLALSKILNVEPYLPDIHIPLWLKDAALISVVLLRSQSRAMKLYDPLSKHAMSEEEQIEWHKVISGSPLILRNLINLAWSLVMLLYRIIRGLKSIFNFLKFKWAKNWISLFFGGVFMLGFAYFIHDLLVAYATRSLKSKHAVAHRGFMKWTVISLITALIASLGFFATNGYMIKT